MATTIKTGYRKLNGHKSSRGISHVRYVGTLAIYENGEHICSLTGNVHRLSPTDALADAQTEAQSVMRQNPTVDVVIE